MTSPTRRRAIAVAGLMAASAAAAVVARPTRQMADVLGMPNLETLFPTQFAEWRVDTAMPVILPSPDVQALLSKIYNQTLARTYVNNQGQRVMLSVAYGGDQSDGTSAHRPEVCYPAQGFAITANSLGQLQLDGRQVPVRRLMSKLGPRDEPITYWVLVGDAVVTTGIGQKLAQMRYGVRGVVADGMLVRVSSIDANPTRAYAVHDRLIADLLAAVPAEQRPRVIGR